MKPRPLEITIAPDVARVAGALISIGPDRWSRQDHQDVHDILAAVFKGAMAQPLNWRWPNARPAAGVDAKAAIAALGAMPRAGKPARLGTPIGVE